MSTVCMFKAYPRQKKHHEMVDLTDAEIEFLVGKNLIPIKDKSNKFELLDTTVNVPGVKLCRVQHNIRTVCPNCHNSDSIVRDQFGGMVLCSQCGNVMDSEVLDDCPEWKSYDDSCNGRCGPPTNTLLPQSSLGTTIGGSCNYKLRTLHNWGLMPYKERSLNNVLNMIKSKCSSAGLSGIIEDDAKVMYKIVSECKPNARYTDTVQKMGNNNLIIRGKNRIGLVAACIYYACRRNNNTRSVKEIASLFSISPARVNKGCKNFIRYVEYKSIDYSTNTSHPSQYVGRFCAKLGIDKNTTDMIMKASINVHRLNIAPKHTPLSIAAACTLLCVDAIATNKLERSTISSSFGISEVTLSKAYNTISQYSNIITNCATVEKIMSDINEINTGAPDELMDRLAYVNTINVNEYSNNITFDVMKYMQYDLVCVMSTTLESCLTYNETHKPYADTIYH